MAFMAQALRAQDEILQAAMVRLALKASSSSITAIRHQQLMFL
jgi:hypothetical protein